MNERLLSAGKIVREIMKMHGKKLVYQNTYYTGTRTVKCYQHTNPLFDSVLEHTITNVLDSLGVKFKVVRSDAKHSYYMGNSFIVKMYDIF